MVTAARPSTEAWIMVDTGFFDDGIELTNTPRLRIPVVQIGSATGGKAYMGAGIYHEPRVRSYNDKAPPTETGQKEISFSVMLQGDDMDEVLKDWEIIENLLNRAVDGSGPNPRGPSVIYVERLHDSSRYAAWDIQTGFLTGVDMGLPGDPFWGMVAQLAVVPGARIGPGFTPQIVDFGATVVNGPQGHLYIPDVEGDYYSVFEARLRDESDPGTVITRVHAGRRNYLSMTEADATLAFYANDSRTTSQTWQPISQFQNPAGAQQFGLQNAILLVKDHSIVLTKPARASALSFHGGRVPNVERSYFVAATAAGGKESAPSPAASLGVDPTAVDVLSSSGFEEAVPLSAAAWQVSSDAREGKTVRWNTASKDDGSHGLDITPNTLGTGGGGGFGAIEIISFGATFYSPIGTDFAPNIYPHLPLTLTARIRALTASRDGYISLGPLSVLTGTGRDIQADGLFHDVVLTVTGSGNPINPYTYAIAVDGAPPIVFPPGVGPIAALATDMSISTQGFGGEAPGVIEFYLGHFKVVDATGTVFETDFSDLTDVAYWTRIQPSIGSEATIAVIPDPLDASNHVLSAELFTDFGAVNASIVNSRAVPPGLTHSGKFAVVNTMGLNTINLPSVASAGILPNGQSDNFAAYLFGGMLLNRGSIRGWTIDDNTFFQIPDDGSRHEYKFIITSAGGSTSFTAPFTVDLFVDGTQRGHKPNLLTLPPLTALSLGVNAPTAAGELSVEFDDWLEADNDYIDLNIVGIRDALSWSSSPAATNYNLYLQKEGNTYVLQNVGNVTNFAVSDVSAWVKTDGLPIGENAGTFAQIRARVATGHNPVRSTPLPEAVQTKEANGILEMVKVGTPSLPPQSRAEGEQTSRDWTLYIDVQTSSGVGAVIEILGLWFFPADEQGWTGITATACGLTQQVEWHFGTNRWGYPYCELLDKNTGEVIGSADVTGKIALRAGDNIVPFLVETDNGQGRPVGNRDTAKFQMGAQYVERWHWDPAVGPPV